MKAIKTVTEQVYQAIYDDIMDGSLPLGSRLTLKDLQAKLQVSSSPIREALTKLLADGLINYQPNIGMSVRTYSSKEIHDVFELMKVFDLMALSLVCDLDNKESLISELEENVSHSEQIISTTSATEWNNYTDLFHDIIWSYSDNTFLNEAASKARMHITIFTTQLANSSDNRERACLEHREILESIKSGDKEQAISLMSKHIDNLSTTLEKN